jgi:hypothetical protein
MIVLEEREERENEEREKMRREMRRIIYIYTTTYTYTLNSLFTPYTPNVINFRNYVISAVNFYQIFYISTNHTTDEPTL